MYVHPVLLNPNLLANPRRIKIPKIQSILSLKNPKSVIKPMKTISTDLMKLPHTDKCFVAIGRVVVASEKRTRLGRKRFGHSCTGLCGGFLLLSLCIW